MMKFFRGSHSGQGLAEGKAGDSGESHPRNLNRSMRRSSLSSFRSLTSLSGLLPHNSKAGPPQEPVYHLCLREGLNFAHSKSAHHRNSFHEGHVEIDLSANDLG